MRYVAKVLSEEPVEMQYKVIAILTTLNAVDKVIKGYQVKKVKLRATLNIISEAKEELDTVRSSGQSYD